MEESEFVPVLEENALQESSMKLVKVEGQAVLLLKVKGEIFAIDNRCPHMGCGFSGGTLEGDVIICPCHDWRFNLKTKQCIDQKGFQLSTFESKVEAGKIWIKPDADISAMF
jgi:3-phenylpropionate/trans-cinnamate dioxygenase ferredoxin subunit